MGKLSKQAWISHIRGFASECQVKMRKSDNWKERYSQAFKHARHYFLEFLGDKSLDELYDYYYYQEGKSIEMSPGEKYLVKYAEEHGIGDNYYNVEDLAYYLAIKSVYGGIQEEILEIKDQLYKLKRPCYPAETGDDGDMQIIHWINAAIGNLEAIDNYIRAK